MFEDVSEDKAKSGLHNFLLLQEDLLLLASATFERILNDALSQAINNVGLDLIAKTKEEKIIR